MTFFLKKEQNENIWLGVPFTYNFIRRVRRVIYEKGNWLLFLKKRGTSDKGACVKIK